MRLPFTQVDAFADAPFAGNPAAVMPLAAPIGRNECNTFNPATNSFGIVNSRLDEDNFAWRAALDFTPNATTLFYASISRGYTL